MDLDAVSIEMHVVSEGPPKSSEGLQVALKSLQIKSLNVKKFKVSDPCLNHLKRGISLNNQLNLKSQSIPK